MTRITLEIPKTEDLEMILLLAKRLNCRVIEDSSEIRQMDNTHQALIHLRNIAENGGLSEIIPDPVLWQKEIRNDKTLLGREE